MSSQIKAIRSGLAKRLMDAVEGECDGLAIDEHQAMAILAYVLEWSEAEEKTASELFARWLEAGPKLAKAAGCYVGIRVSDLPDISKATA